VLDLALVNFRNNYSYYTNVQVNTVSPNEVLDEYL
jgi:hypothetical protein